MAKAKRKQNFKVAWSESLDILNIYLDMTALIQITLVSSNFDYKWFLLEILEVKAWTDYF